MKVAMYCRVGKVQDDDILLDRQIENCRKYAKENNIRDYRIYLDKDVSGIVPFQERPMGKQLLEDIKKDEIKEVVIKDFPQISRSIDNAVEIMKYLENSKVKLRIMTTNSELFFNLPEITKYLRSINSRIKKG